MTAKTSNATFASMLVEIMQRNGLTQRELARRTAISPENLCRILKPTYPHRPGRTIDRIVSEIGCTPEEREELYRRARIVPPEYVQAFLAGTLRLDLPDSPAIRLLRKIRDTNFIRNVAHQLRAEIDAVLLA